MNGPMFSSDNFNVSLPEDNWLLCFLVFCVGVISHLAQLSGKLEKENENYCMFSSTSITYDELSTLRKPLGGINSPVRCQ